MARRVPEHTEVTNRVLVPQYPARDDKTSVPRLGSLARRMHGCVPAADAERRTAREPHAAREPAASCDPQALLRRETRNPSREGRPAQARAGGEYLGEGDAKVRTSFSPYQYGTGSRLGLRPALKAPTRAAANDRATTPRAISAMSAGAAPDSHRVALLSTCVRHRQRAAVPERL